MPPKKKEIQTDPQFKDCPSCGEAIRNEAALCRFCGAGISKNHFRACPMCQEMVRKEAILCRYCKSSIVGTPPQDEPINFAITGNPPVFVNPKPSPTAVLPDDIPSVEEVAEGIETTDPVSDVMPLLALTQEQVLPFIREAERLVLKHKLPSFIVYWSKHSASRLLPAADSFKELKKCAKFVSVFSEDQNKSKQLYTVPDQWGFFIWGSKFCLIVYGQAIDAMKNGMYACSAAMDPALVKNSLVRLMPSFEGLDANEARKLNEALTAFDPIENQQLVASLSRYWPDDVS